MRKRSNKIPPENNHCFIVHILIVFKMMVKSKNNRKSIITSCECVGCAHLSAPVRTAAVTWQAEILFYVDFLCVVQ